MTKAEIARIVKLRHQRHIKELARRNKLVRSAHPPAIEVLKELIRDIQSVGEEYTQEDWPDLYETYLHALKVVGQKTISQTIISSYSKGKCPDCAEPIPEDVQEGVGCTNCLHVFWLPKEDDNDERKWLKYHRETLEDLHEDFVRHTDAKVTFEDFAHAKWEEADHGGLDEVYPKDNQ